MISSERSPLLRSTGLLGRNRPMHDLLLDCSCSTHDRTCCDNGALIIYQDYTFSVLRCAAIFVSFSPRWLRLLPMLRLMRSETGRCASA